MLFTNRVTKTLAAAVMSLGILSSASIQANAATYTFPGFTHDTTERLVFENNPEVLLNSDMADNTLGHKYLLQTNHNPGIVYRHNWEHINKTGSTISYALEVTNPMSTTQSIQILRQGFSSSSAQFNGGIPIANMYNIASGSTHSLAPFEKKRILVQTGLLWGGFFSGFAELKVTSANTLIVRNIAYKDSTKVDGNHTYEGWISAYTGEQFGAHRTYKGLQNAANVKTTLDVTIAGGEAAGTQVLSYQTHDVPGRLLAGNTAKGDMVPIQMPLYPSGPVTYVTVDPTQAFTYDPDPATKTMPPNLGNYAVKYMYTGTLRNNGATQRNVEFWVKRNNLNSNTSFGYRPNGSTTWKAVIIGPNQPDGLNSPEYMLFSVPVAGYGTVSYSYDYILGDPASGGQSNVIRIR